MKWMQYRTCAIAISLGIPLLGAAELPPACKGPTALTKAMHDTPSASVYDAAGAFFADNENLKCALAAFQEAVRLEPRSAEAHYDLAVLLARMEQLPEAAKEFRLALENKPDMAMAHSSLGSVLSDMGENVQAEAEFREALKADPKSVFALDHLAQALVAQRRYDAAIRYWQEALALQPGSQDITLALATAIYQDAAAKQDAGVVGAHDAGTKEAIRMLTDLTKASPDMKAAHFTLGNIYAHEARFREAADEYAQVMRLDPADTEALRAGVKALVTVSAFQDALAPAQDFVRRKPTDPEGHTLLGAIYRGLGEYPKAEAELGRAVAGNPNDFQAQYQLGFVLARNDKPKEALEHLKKAVALKPTESSAQFQLAAVLRTVGDSGQSNQVAEEFKQAKQQEFKVSQLAAKGNQANEYLQAGQPGLAAGVYRQMLEIDPLSARTEYNLALALEATGDAKGGRKALEKAVELDAKMAVARGELGRLDLAAGDVAAARKWLESAVAIDPQLVSALGNLGVIYALKGENSRAERVFRQAVEDDPQYMQGRLNLGLILAQQQRYGEAETELDKALQLAPNDLSALSAMGKVQMRLGKNKEGVATLEQVAKLNPNSAGAHLDLAIALAEGYDLTRALAEAETAVRLAPNAAAPHFNRASILFDLGRSAEARPEFVTAERLAPEMPEPHYFLALMEKQAGNYDAAISQLQTVVKYQPRNAMAWHLLGQCLDAEAKPEEAIRAWRQALAINPQYSQALWSLAHAVRPADGAEADRLMQRFDEIQKKNRILDRAGALDNDAVALMQQSDWPAAIGKLKEAIQICNNCAANPDLHKNLGLVYCHAGKIEDGEKELRLAQAAKAGDPDIEKALTQIARVRSEQAR